MIERAAICLSCNTRLKLKGNRKEVTCPRCGHSVVFPDIPNPEDDPSIEPEIIPKETVSIPQEVANIATGVDVPTTPAPATFRVPPSIETPQYSLDTVRKLLRFRQEMAVASIGMLWVFLCAAAFALFVGYTILQSGNTSAGLTVGGTVVVIVGFLVYFRWQWNMRTAELTILYMILEKLDHQSRHEDP
jgi:DNA-directed RNA polymerase subunit RPC12/RpoP